MTSVTCVIQRHIALFPRVFITSDDVNDTYEEAFGANHTAERAAPWVASLLAFHAIGTLEVELWRDTNSGDTVADYMGEQAVLVVLRVGLFLELAAALTSVVDAGAN